MSCSIPHSEVSRSKTRSQSQRLFSVPGRPCVNIVGRSRLLTAPPVRHEALTRSARVTKQNPGRRACGYALMSTLRSSLSFARCYMRSTRALSIKKFIRGLTRFRLRVAATENEQQQRKKWRPQERRQAHTHTHTCRFKECHAERERNKITTAANRVTSGGPFGSGRVDPTQVVQGRSSGTDCPVGHTP